MNKIIGIFFLLFLSTPFFAEAGSRDFAQTLATYNADIDRYKLAQSKHPAHLVTYADRDGDTLRTILDPNRYESMLQSSQSSPSNTQSMSQLTSSQLDLIYAMYVQAFTRQWGVYDQEYLDVLDMKLRAFKTSWRQYAQKLNREKMNADEVAHVQSLFSQPEAMITELDHNIQKRRFTAVYKPQALARLAMLKGMVHEIKPKP